MATMTSTVVARHHRMAEQRAKDRLRKKEQKARRQAEAEAAASEEADFAAFLKAEAQRLDREAELLRQREAARAEAKKKVRAEVVRKSSTALDLEDDEWGHTTEAMGPSVTTEAKDTVAAPEVDDADTKLAAVDLPYTVSTDGEAAAALQQEEEEDAAAVPVSAADGLSGVTYEGGTGMLAEAKEEEEDAAIADRKHIEEEQQVGGGAEDVAAAASLRAPTTGGLFGWMRGLWAEVKLVLTVVGIVFQGACKRALRGM